MVGAFSVVGSSMVDSNTRSCLCLDVMPSNNLSRVDWVLPRNSMGRKHRPRPGSLDLSSSFLDYSSVKAITSTKNLKKQRKMSSVIVDELAGQYEDNFGDVTSQILNYFTYKAVRTVLNQLYEMNPTQYRWFYDYVATNEHGYGKRFLRNLGKEKHELAERIMVTRLHLYGKWIKKCDHAAMYKTISDQNLELMRERLIETVIWPSDDTNTEENRTGQVLLHGRVENGLYPIAGNVSLPHKIYGLATTIGQKTSAEQWHYRLGHPSQAVFQSLLRSSCISLSPAATNKSFFLFSLSPWQKQTNAFFKFHTSIH